MNKRETTPRKKLVLNRATVRHLTTGQLKGVAGGRINESIMTRCDCPPDTHDDPTNDYPSKFTCPPGP
jgi:hypothetical protein